MASLKHEAIVRLFRNRPELASELLHVLQLPLPAYTQTRIESAELTDIEPAEYRADTVVLLGDGKPDGKPVLGIIVEVQLSRKERKRFTWPAYVTLLRARFECPTCVSGLHGDRANGQVVSQADRTGARQRRPRGRRGSRAGQGVACRARITWLAHLQKGSHAHPRMHRHRANRRVAPQGCLGGVCRRTVLSQRWHPPLRCTPARRWLLFARARHVAIPFLQSREFIDAATELRHLRLRAGLLHRTWHEHAVDVRPSGSRRERSSVAFSVRRRRAGRLRDTESTNRWRASP